MRDGAPPPDAAPFTGELAAVAELGADIVSVLAADGTLLYNSPAALRIHGYDPASMIGRSTLDYVHPDDLPAVQTAFAHVLAAHGNTVTVRYRYRHADGHWTPMEATGRNLLADPRVNGIIAISRDVTPRAAGGPIPVPVGCFDPVRRVVTAHAVEVSLTPVEARLLAYLASRAGDVVAPAELLRDVWGYAGAARTRTVYVTVDRLRKKIELDPAAPTCLLSRPGLGYLYRPPR